MLPEHVFYVSRDQVVVGLLNKSIEVSLIEFQITIRIEFVLCLYNLNYLYSDSGSVDKKC